MDFSPLVQPVAQILRKNRDHYLLPYQIGLHIQRNYPTVWNQLIQNYGASAGNGAGIPYSWATQIARALDYCLSNGVIPGLHKAHINTDGIEVKGIPPGNEVVSIWKVD